MSEWQLSNRSRGWGATKCVMMQVAGFVVWERMDEKDLEEKDLDEVKFWMCFAIWILMLAFAQNRKHCTLHYVKWKREVRIEMGKTDSTFWQTDWNFYCKYVCIMMIRTRHFWFLQAQQIAKSSQKENKQCKIKYNEIIQDAHQSIVNLWNWKQNLTIET